jgi:hypothetical protein
MEAVEPRPKTTMIDQDGTMTIGPGVVVAAVGMEEVVVVAVLG